MSAHDEKPFLTHWRNSKSRLRPVRTTSRSRSRTEENRMNLEDYMDDSQTHILVEGLRWVDAEFYGS
jgi:hypothetical protein